MLYSTDIGLLILRVGIGLNMALMHGWGKLTAGPEMWRKIGASMPAFGLDFLPLLWGVLATFAEFGCSLLLALGLLFRPALALLAITMGVAVWVHLNMPADSPVGGWKGANHALLYLLIYAGLFVSGPGKHVLVLGKK